MHVQYRPISFDLDAFITHELQYMSAFYRDAGELNQDVHNLFEFPVHNRDRMPFYAISDAGATRIAQTLEEIYAMMVDATKRLLMDEEAIRTFFDCEFIRRRGRDFIDYARHTFNARGMVGQTLYGRFDVAVDPTTETVKGIYEFNGDTPVMLCESINLQHMLTQQVTGSAEPQYNEWYGRFSEMLAAQGVTKDKRYAVVCDTRFVEDMATCETLAQSLGEHATCYFLDIKELDYDHLHVEKPFYLAATDEYLDGIFVLSPWEEMVENFPIAFMQWRNWARNVSLFEPAWRWFMSNKGMLAYMTHLLETDEDFVAKWKHVPHLPTYLTAEPFQEKGLAYVAKPMLGRLSSNIQIFDATGTLTHESEGGYGDTPMVYQAYCEPGRVDGRNNFIMGAWMNASANARLATVGTLCIREFDAPVLDLQNERFIPHILVD